MGEVIDDGVKNVVFAVAIELVLFRYDCSVFVYVYGVSGVAIDGEEGHIEHCTHDGMLCCYVLLSYGGELNP